MATTIWTAERAVEKTILPWQGDLTRLLYLLEQQTDQARCSYSLAVNPNANFSIQEIAQVTVYPAEKMHYTVQVKDRGKQQLSCTLQPYKIMPDLNKFTVQSTVIQPSQAGHYHITVNGYGLVGHHGALPSYYQSCLVQALQAKKTSLVDFLNIFQHRMLCLHYRTWAYARPTLCQPTLVSKMLASLAGLHFASTKKNFTLLNYAGLLRRRPLARATIETILQDYFQLPIQVKDFQVSSMSLSEQGLTKLGFANTALGQNMMLGKNALTTQIKCQILVGPLNQQQFYQLLPWSKMADAVKNWARNLIPASMEIEIRLRVLAESVPKWQLSQQTPQRLGFTSWCGWNRAGREADEVKYII